MSLSKVILSISLIVSAAAIAGAQGTIVITDPTVSGKAAKLAPAEQKLFDTVVLKPVKKKLLSDTCTGEVEIAGVVHGAFTAPKTTQTLVFYQFCQTGNGLGRVGLAVLDHGKVAANFVEDSGWSIGVEKVSDVDRNGIDEVALTYGGGMHQGSGGSGVELIQFVSGKPVGMGFFISSSYNDTDPTTYWKVTAKPGKTPVYYRQKYLSGEDEKYRRSGANTRFRLGKTNAKFEAVR